MKAQLIKVNTQALRSARIKACMTESSIARRLGTTLQRYHEWESGDSRPTMEQIRRMALILRCPVLFLVCLGVSVG